MKIIHTLLSQTEGGATWLQVIILSVLFMVAMFLLILCFKDAVKIRRELYDESDIGQTRE